MSRFDKYIEIASENIVSTFGIKGTIEDEKGHLTNNVLFIKQSKTRKFEEGFSNVSQEEVSIFVVRKNLEDLNDIKRISFDNKSYSVVDVKGKEDPFVEFIISENPGNSWDTIEEKFEH